MSIVRTVIRMVSIAQVAAYRTALVERSCGGDELPWARNASVRTLAGTIALKLAVVELLGKLRHGKAMTVQEIRIVHDASGAPRLAPPDDRIRVSISHTGATAYGCAVLEEREHE